ncbi:MAG: hypothetical protein ACRC3Y_07490 [Romboutsia sp.]|uniref:hypothetical protein n=1 Tax=Romboutsia sp. TaxID=1965302 RepID=UPI003F2B39D2
MAYPQVATTIPDTTSINSILQSEAGILDCMAQFFSGTTISGNFEEGVVDMIKNETDLANRVALLNTILPAYSNKECAIAEVLCASARKLAADNNINPCSLKCSDSK